jgi:hypothetical protein
MTRTPRQTPDPGFMLCPACNGSRLCQVCRGTLHNPKGGPCVACDYGTCDLCDGEGQLPEDWTPDPPPATDFITFEQGHESAADSPWGFQRVCVSTDGQLEYEHRSRAGRRIVRGTVDGERVKALRREFSRTSFPQKPQETFQPGASIIRLTTTPPTCSVLIDYFDGMKMDGYREIIRELSELNNALREDDGAALSTWRFERAPEVAT